MINAVIGLSGGAAIMAAIWLAIEITFRIRDRRNPGWWRGK